MDYSTLLEEALEERGNATMVVARPGDGEQAVIQAANGCFAQMMGRRADLLAGLRLGELQSVVEQAADWTALMSAMRSLTPLKLDIRLRVCDRESWLGFALSFKTDMREGTSYGILIGRDITQARRRALQENESQRLLASVFLRISAPVVIVRGNGVILMGNPAFHRLVGYTAEEISTLHVDALTPPERSGEISTARAKQLREGNSYELDFETLTKSGARIPVRQTSVLLRDTQDLRVVTLLPCLPAPRRRVEIIQSDTVAAIAAQSIGQVQAISLAAFKTAFGDSWERLASRAMMLAEQIIKRRLATADVYNRSDDHGFVIWFDSQDEERNVLVLGKAAREIRLRFLAEFGEDAAAHINSHVDTAVVSFAGEIDAPGASKRLPTPALLDHLREKRQEAAAEATALLQELRGSPAEVQPVIDRHGETKPIVVVDFALRLRRRAADLASFGGRPDDAGIDLLRVDLAVTELGASRGGSVLVPVAWPTLCQPGPRRHLDQRLSSCDPALLCRLMFAVSGVPAFPTAKRWNDIVSPLRRQFGEIGLMIALEDADAASMQEAIVSDWPLSLLVIDGTAAGCMAPDLYYGLAAAARRRGIPVLVRAGASDNIRDWHELGATMFAGTT